MPISDTQLQSAIKATAGKDGIINTATERKAFLIALGATKSTNNGVGENITRLKLDGENTSLSALESAGIKNKGYQSGSLTGGDLEELFGPSGFNFEQLKAKLGAAKTDTPETADTKTAEDAAAMQKYTEDLAKTLPKEMQEALAKSEGAFTETVTADNVLEALKPNVGGYKFTAADKEDFVSLAAAIKAHSVAKKDTTTKTDPLFTQENLSAILRNRPLNNSNFAEVTSTIDPHAVPYYDFYKDSNGAYSKEKTENRNAGAPYFRIISNCVGEKWYKAAIDKYAVDHNIDVTKLKTSAEFLAAMAADKALTADYAESLFLSVVPGAVKDASGNYNVTVEQLKAAGFLGVETTAAIPPTPTPSTQTPEVKTTAGKDNSKTVEVGQA